MHSFRVLLALVALAACHSCCLAKLDGAWVQGATPTTLKPPTAAGGACLCAPDPLLPDPACILCLCGQVAPNGTAEASIAAASMHWSVQSSTATRPNKVCGGMEGAVATRLKYATGATADCACVKDPFLKGAAWMMCRCPKRTSPTRNAFGVPTTLQYSAWPATNFTSPPQTQWPRCSGKYALCSMANCTLVFPGKKASSVQLAECGCIERTPQNGLGKLNLVDPTYILSQPLRNQQQKQCPDNAKSPGCKKLDSTPICKAIKNNWIYGGKYDLISTFATSPELGGFNKLCLAPKGVQGMYAQCMTAACFRRKAFDGSPITCYCPVYKSEKYLVGSPVNEVATCEPTLPYVLSGVAA